MTHKFVGEVVMHCHLLNHEDTGMMMTTEIVNAGTNAYSSSLNVARTFDWLGTKTENVCDVG